MKKFDEKFNVFEFAKDAEMHNGHVYVFIEKGGTGFPYIFEKGDIITLEHGGMVVIDSKFPVKIGTNTYMYKLCGSIPIGGVPNDLLNKGKKFQHNSNEIGVIKEELNTSEDLPTVRMSFKNKEGNIPDLEAKIVREVILRRDGLIGLYLDTNHIFVGDILETACEFYLFEVKYRIEREWDSKRVCLYLVSLIYSETTLEDLYDALNTGSILKEKY